MNGQQLSVQAAAGRIGLTEYGLRKAIDRGELRPVPGTLPLKLDPADVERFITARRTAAIQRLAARSVDLAQLAADTRAFLRPPAGAPASGGMSRLGPDVIAVFGVAALTAAAITNPNTCGWCAATFAAGMLGTAPPAYTQPLAVLLGPPCAKDRAVVAEALEKARAAVHGPSAARPAVPAAQRPTVPPPTAHAAVQRPVARPAGRATRTVLHAALRAAGVRPDRHEHGPSVVCPRCTP
jgi:hypothetical protein